MTNLRAIFPSLLTTVPQLRLKLIDINGALHWALAQDNELLFDDLFYRVDPPGVTPKTFPLDTHPIWRVEIWNTVDDNNINKTHLHLFISHALADGTTAFTVFSLFSHIALGKGIPQKFIDAGKGPLLTSFQKPKFFPAGILTDRKVPASWTRLKEMRLYPDVTLPSHVVNTRWSTDYASVSAFCEKHKVTVQAIDMALMERAIRQYNKGKIAESEEIAVNVQVNTRRNPDAAEEHKKTIFYPGTAPVLPFVHAQGSLLRDILHCKEQLRNTLKSGESTASYIAQASFIDPSTLAAEFPAEWPSPIPHNLVFASNIGLVCEGCADLTFGAWSGVDEYGYWTNLYTYTNGETLYFTLVHPFNIPSDFVDTIRQSADEVIDLIHKDS